MDSLKIAVLMTCFNRKDKTVASLNKVYSQKLNSTVNIDVYIVDDGSKDGTSIAIKEKYPNTNVFQGSGNLYWNGGMRWAFLEAQKNDYDFYLWLNDDTIIFDNAFNHLIKTYSNISKQYPKSIIVGSVMDMESDKLTYGGCRIAKKFDPVKYSLVQPGENPIECDTMNGNCVLIPKSVVSLIGVLDEQFTHSMGDYDYGLRTKKAGGNVWVASGFIGRCSRNSDKGSWREKNISFKERWKRLTSPKGIPVKDWKIYTRRHCGVFWFLFWLRPYIKFFYQSAFRTFK